MRYLKLMALVSAMVFLQSCKTSRVSNSIAGIPILFGPESHKTVSYNRYCIIYYNEKDSDKPTEKAVKQIDSIDAIKNEFQKLLYELRPEKADSGIDTISKYKLLFISENYKNEQLNGPGTQDNVLKKCDQNAELKYFIKPDRQIRSYSKKYLTVYLPPIVDYGNTYVRTFYSQYYFEKINSNE